MARADGATLQFEILSQADNKLVLTFNCNAWGAFASGKPAVDYVVIKELRGAPEWQTVTVKLEELRAIDPQVTAPLDNWQSVTELSLGASGTSGRGKDKLQVTSSAWQGTRVIRNLRWEGGKYAEQKVNAAPLNATDYQKNFNDAIKKSLEQEKQDQLRK